MKVNLIRLLTFLFSISCVSFVFYQGNNCWIKYKTIPQTTQVSIEKATRHPDITFCPTWDFYNKRKNDCNISAASYFDESEYQWNGTLNCSDPIKLHKDIVGDVTELIGRIDTYGDDIALHDWLDLDDLRNFRVLDHTFGRCYSLQVPPNVTTVNVILFPHQTSVYVHAPGNFLGSSSKATAELMPPETRTAVEVLYETFKVLSFDGEKCQNDKGYRRDNCLYSASQEVIKAKYKNLSFVKLLILQESENEIGCTTPFHPDKSNICLEYNKAYEAVRIFEDITLRNLTKANQLCPKPCQQYTISFTSYKEMSSKYFNGAMLLIQFPKYIRVSRSYYSYTLLELLAEVGGYVGLFLGVSIIQISGLLRILITKLDKHVKNWMGNLPN